MKTKLTIFAASLSVLLSACGGSSGAPQVVVQPNQPPVAQFSLSQPQVAVGERVSFDASSSHDPERLQLRYYWQIKDTANELVTPADNTAQLFHYYPQRAGNYTVLLTVTDSQGASHSTEQPLSVAASGQHSLKIDAPDTAKQGDYLELQAIFSHMISDKVTANYQWQLVGKPAASAAQLENAAHSRAGFVADQPGEYQLELSLQLGNFIRQTVTHSITVYQTGDVPPQAKIDPSHSRQLWVNEQLQLSSLSSDSDGDVLSYHWTIQGGAYVPQPQHQAEFLFQPTALATYTICLQVNDGKHQDQDCTGIEVTDSNRQPVALFSVDSTTLAPNTPIKLISQASDPDGDRLSFSWRIVSAPEGSDATLDLSDEQQPLFQADKAGDYQIQLQVSDAWQQSAPFVLPLQLQATAQPQLSINAERLITVGHWSRLQAELTANHDAAQFNWSVLSQPQGANGEFQAGNQADTMFKADLSGDYLLQVAVSGPALVPQVATVLLSADSNLPPVARIAGQTRRYGLVGIKQTFDAGISFDPQGEAISYSWQLFDENSATLLASQSGGALFTVEPQFAANYRVKLQVSDGLKQTESNVLLVIADELPQQLQLSGSYVNVLGQPVAGIKVTTNHIRFRPGYIGVYEAYTDTAGQFSLSFERPQPDSWQPGIKVGYNLRYGYQLQDLILTDANELDLGQTTLADLQKVRFEARYCANLAESAIRFMIVGQRTEHTQLDIAATAVLSFSEASPVMETLLPAPATFLLRSNQASVNAQRQFSLAFTPDQPQTVVVDLCNP
ncbi:MAG: hypothetical protein KKE08_15290 [Gammaproteobacteria bacterium]|nr:hypothetical protein [Gammaproteobacteria bacterium]MBU2184390.1 hypothetical protein [Gammaproteobacteria bacterium]MBU2206228.1 hypothetical protein [Gammaproteobacteria bacterium]